MTPETSALITLAAVILSAAAAVGAAVVGWFNRRQIHEIHLMMNSRLDELLETTKQVAMARGAQDARADDKAARLSVHRHHGILDDE